MVLALYLLRHAKSAWDTPSAEDFDRPLSERGRREADWVAGLVRARGGSPSRILCSSSQRTRETLASIVPVLSRDASIDITRRIYEAPAERLLAALGEQSTSHQSVMLVGHNPGLEDLANLLAGGGDPGLIAALRRKYPPAGLAHFEFELERWSDIRAVSGRLVAFDVPPRDGS